VLGCTPNFGSLQACKTFFFCEIRHTPRPTAPFLVDKMMTSLLPLTGLAKIIVVQISVLCKSYLSNGIYLEEKNNRKKGTLKKRGSPRHGKQKKRKKKGHLCAKENIMKRTKKTFLLNYVV